MREERKYACALYMYMYATHAHYIVYQVRVSAGVQVNRDPPQYEFNEPTKWVIASGVVTTVPPQPRKPTYMC